MVLVTTGSQDSKDGVVTEDTKPLPVPEEMGKNKVASWLTNQGLKKVRSNTGDHTLWWRVC